MYLLNASARICSLVQDIFCWILLFCLIPNLRQVEKQKVLYKNFSRNHQFSNILQEQVHTLPPTCVGIIPTKMFFCFLCTPICDKTITHLPYQYKNIITLKSRKIVHSFYTSRHVSSPITQPGNNQKNLEIIFRLFYALPKKSISSKHIAK